MIDLKYWVWLSGIFSCGSEKPNHLLSMHSYDPKIIYESLKNDRTSFGFLSDNELHRISLSDLARAEGIISRCDELGIDIITQVDPRFPNGLKRVYGAPVLLYVKGDISYLSTDISISVVGTRNASEYGEYVTGNLCYELAKNGIVVISGCAVGIDRISHVGCLKGGGKTIGVIGCGIDINYPVKNKDLKEEIVKRGGALISELPPGTPVNGKIFPVRNRIIAGLSSGVLVTEAPIRSGALITVEHGIEQGKDIFCVPPHNIYDERYRGVVQYLLDGATPVYSVDDILNEYIGLIKHNAIEIKRCKVESVQSGVSFSNVNVAEQGVEYKTKVSKSTVENISEGLNLANIKINIIDNNDLTEDQKMVVSKLDIVPMHIEEIVSKVDISHKEVLCIMTELEMLDIVVSYSGGRYGLYISK